MDADNCNTAQETGLVGAPFTADQLIWIDRIISARQTGAVSVSSEAPIPTSSASSDPPSATLPSCAGQGKRRKQKWGQLEWLSHCCLKIFRARFYRGSAERFRRLAVLMADASTGMLLNGQPPWGGAYTSRYEHRDAFLMASHHGVS